MDYNKNIRNMSVIAHVDHVSASRRGDARGFARWRGRVGSPASEGLVGGDPTRRRREGEDAVDARVSRERTTVVNDRREVGMKTDDEKKRAR